MWYIGRILKGIYVNRPLYLYWNGTKDFSKCKGFQPSLIIVSNLLSSKNSEIMYFLPSKAALSTLEMIINWGEIRINLLIWVVWCWVVIPVSKSTLTASFQSTTSTLSRGKEGSREVEVLVGVRQNGASLVYECITRWESTQNPVRLIFLLCSVKTTLDNVVSQVATKDSHLRPFELHHEVRLGHMQMSQFFLFKKLLIRSTHMVVGT